MNGSEYADNSRYLFEWILRQNHPEICPLWLTKSPDMYRALKNENKPVAMIGSWVGTKCLAQARLGVFTNSLYDLALHPYILPDSIRLIALRHGKSVKKVRFARIGHKLSHKETAQRKYESKLIKYAISTSEFISDFQEESLQIGRQKHIITGYPRNDVLINPTHEMEMRWNDFFHGKDPGTTILYAPSWRHGREPTHFFPFSDFDKVDLFNFLEKNEMTLLLRPHRNDFLKYPELKSFLNDLATNSDFIHVVSHDVFPDVNMILPFIDILISDYSSLYHDYLLLDRPMIFIPYDYDDFEKQNGFHYNYFSYLPGPAIKTFKELCLHLNQIHYQTDSYRHKRHVLKNLVHTHKDSRSCERVANLISNIIRSYKENEN